MQCLTFYAAGRTCALPLEHVVETMRMRPIEHVAAGLPFVCGLARIRGRAVPVVDLALLAFGAPSTAVTRIVTVRGGEGRLVALAVGDVTGIVPIDGADELPQLIADDLLSSVAFAGETLVLVLRAARIIEKAVA